MPPSINICAICGGMKDQGKGIPPEMQLEISSGEASGVGLRGMLERVRLIGGAFDIQSDGSGTLIAIALPLMRVAQK